MLKSISAVAAVLAATALVAPTVSQAAARESVRVSYADLNLGSDTGQRILGQRIDHAARTVCMVGKWRNLALVHATEECRDETIAAARPAFEAAVHDARRGTVTVLDAAALIVTAQ